jgi:integrase/recombinase XerC
MNSTETEDTPQNFDQAHDEKTEVLTAFDRWLQINHSALLTRQSYERSVRFFWDFLSLYHGKSITKMDIVAVTMTDMRAFLAYRSENRASHTTNAQSLSGLKTFYRFLIQQGHTLSWSLHRLRRPRLPRTLPRPLDQSQLDPLMAPPLLHHASWIEWRNYSAMVLLYATGLRIQEVLNINWGDWGKDAGLSVVSKGDKARIVPVLPIALNAVNTYWQKNPWGAKNGAETPLFLGEKGGRLQASILQKSLRAMRLAFGLPDHVTPHSFRHSFASHLLDGGASLRDVQELLGHSSVRATQKYTQTTQKRLQELYQSAHPSMTNSIQKKPSDGVIVGTDSGTADGAGDGALTGTADGANA